MNIPYNIENFNENNIIAFHRATDETTNTQRDFHLHNFFEIYVFLNGDANYFVEQTAYSLKRGNVLIMNNHEIHKVNFLSDAIYERMAIHFSPNIAKALSTPNTNLTECFLNHPNGINNLAHFDEKELEEFTDLLTNLIKAISDNSYGNDVLIRAYMTQILLMINKKYIPNVSTNKEYYGIQTPVLSKQLKEILEYINLNLNSELSLEILEKNFLIDKYHLSRLFKKETGSTIYNYILIKRIALAKELLSKGNNVTEVCAMCGFCDYSNFIRTFKKITGYPPAKYNKLKDTLSVK